MTVGLFAAVKCASFRVVVQRTASDDGAVLPASIVDARRTEVIARRNVAYGDIGRSVEIETRK